MRPIVADRRSSRSISRRARIQIAPLPKDIAAHISRSLSRGGGGEMRARVRRGASMLINLRDWCPRFRWHYPRRDAIAIASSPGALSNSHFLSRASSRAAEGKGGAWKTRKRERKREREKQRWDNLIVRYAPCAAIYSERGDKLMRIVRRGISARGNRRSRRAASVEQERARANARAQIDASHVATS